MSNSFRVDEATPRAGVTISFGQHFQASEQFDQVFKVGMALVERTAGYLDGAGRAEAKALQPAASVLYATESMRLTTRLLDLASWLLIRRALKEGEISEAEALKKRQRVKLQSLGRPSHIKGFETLPEGIRDLIAESFSLLDRIVQLDRAMMCKIEAVSDGAPAANPVALQLDRLRVAFVAKSA